MFDRWNGGQIIVKTARKERPGHNSRKRVASAGHGGVRHPLSKGGCGLSLLGQRVGWSTWAIPCPQPDFTRLSNANIVSEIVRRRDMSGRGNFATINPLVTLARAQEGSLTMGNAPFVSYAFHFHRKIRFLAKRTWQIDSRFLSRSIPSDHENVVYYTLSYTDQFVR